MKYLAYSLLVSSALVLVSCGWTDSQKEAARKSIGDGFSEGLENSGATVDPKVKEVWLDCVMEKATEKWTFDELAESPDGLETLQADCAKEVGLYDAITVE